MRTFFATSFVASSPPKSLSSVFQGQHGEILVTSHNMVQTHSTACDSKLKAIHNTVRHQVVALERSFSNLTSKSPRNISRYIVAEQYLKNMW